METEENGYYVMLIGGESIQNVVDIASKWNVEGLLILLATMKNSIAVFRAD